MDREYASDTENDRSSRVTIDSFTRVEKKRPMAIPDYQSIMLLGLRSFRFRTGFGLPRRTEEGLLCE